MGDEISVRILYNLKPVTGKGENNLNLLSILEIDTYLMIWRNPSTILRSGICNFSDSAIRLIFFVHVAYNGCNSSKVFKMNLHIFYPQHFLQNVQELSMKMSIKWVNQIAQVIYHRKVISISACQSLSSANCGKTSFFPSKVESQSTLPIKISREIILVSARIQTHKHFHILTALESRCNVKWASSE